MATDKRPSRKRSATKSAKASKPRPMVVGDHGLCGSTRASVPSDWFMGVVVWAGAGDLLIDRSTENGNTWRQLVHVSNVRAVGTLVDLCKVRRAAGDAVRALVVDMHDAEVALGRRRDAIWAKVAELADAGLAIIPPDFAAIEADETAVRAICEESDQHRPFDEGVFRRAEALT